MDQMSFRFTNRGILGSDSEIKYLNLLSFSVRDVVSGSITISCGTSVRGCMLMQICKLF